MVLQLVKKFPAFYGTQKFITVLTSARHLSLSWAISIQSPQPPPTSWRSILILSSHLRLGPLMVSFPQVSSPEPRENLSRPPYATCPAHLIHLDFTTRTILGKEYRSTCPQNPGFVNRKFKNFTSLKKSVKQNLFLKHTIPSTLLQISVKSCIDH